MVTLARLKYAIRSDTILRSPPPFPGPLIEFSLAAFAVVVKEPATEFIVRKLVNFDTLHQPYIVYTVYRENFTDSSSSNLSTLILEKLEKQIIAVGFFKILIIARNFIIRF